MTEELSYTRAQTNLYGKTPKQRRAGMARFIHKCAVCEASYEDKSFGLAIINFCEECSGDRKIVHDIWNSIVKSNKEAQAEWNTSLQ